MAYVCRDGFNQYAQGAEAASQIEVNASIAAQYMAVSGDANLNYSITKTFQSSYQYALMSYNQNQLLAKFDDFADSINESVLKARLGQIPTFDSTKPEIVSEYQRLFRSLGSHVITSASYGGRFQLVSRATFEDGMH